MGPQIQKKMLLAAWSINNSHWIINQAYNIPLRKIFREVINFDPQEETYKYGKEEMNKRFLEVLEIEKPDYIHLFLVWDEFYPETLLKIKEILPNTKVTHWNGDDDIKFDNYTIPYSATIDYQFISQLQFVKRYDSYNIPWFDMLGADINKFRPMNVKKKYDVAFIGTPKGDRLPYMRYLLKQGVNFVLGGAGWDDYPEFKDRYLGRIADEDFIKLINETKINLCFSQNYFSVPHVLERSLAVNACNSFALTEYVEGYFPKFTEGKDIVTFKSPEELCKQIEYYLKYEKERERIAQNAYNKIVKNFSNQKIMGSAYRAIEKDKRPLYGLETRKYLDIKPIYLDRKDLKKDPEHLREKIGAAKYVCFKNKAHEPVSFRDYFQVYSMELLKKPLSVCDAYLSSSLIGDYATFDLFYAYHYHKDKSYVYDNMDISQFMVERDFLFNNLDKFISLYKGKKPLFVTPENTSFLSMPLIRTTRIKRIPAINADHITFWNLDLELVVLRNQKRLFKSSYLYKLILYSLFVNNRVLRYLLVDASKKSKKPFGLKVSKFFSRIWK